MLRFGEVGESFVLNCQELPASPWAAEVGAIPSGSHFASLACSLAVGLDAEGALEPAWVCQTHCPVGMQLCWAGGRLSLSTLVK